ncbi:hypothetical protein [Endothiovibrio diazotrophicus]
MKIGRSFLLAASLLATAGSTLAAEKMKPFVLASRGAGEMAATVEQVRDQLTGAGFEVVGSYSPYEGATVLVATNDALKQAAAKTKFGVYGAGERVAVTAHGGEIQVGYINPSYMAAAYRMEDDLAGVSAALKGALGAVQDYGCEKECMTAKQLNGYHYTFGMPYFDDADELGSYGSYQEAVAAVEKGLAAGTMGVTKVYRIDLPGKEATVFGVGLSGAKGAGKDQDDKFIMNEIDFKEIRSTAHLPYEMVVVGDSVYALSAKFRIAIDFPDLSMMGDNSFMNIMGSPDAIRKALAAAAGAKEAVSW